MQIMGWNEFGAWMWASLQGLASIAPLGVLLTVIVAAVAIWQKVLSDRRAAWWDRMEWSANTALTDNDSSRRVGGAALKVVQLMPGVTKVDLPLMEAIAVALRDRALDGTQVINQDGPVLGVDDPAHAADNGETEDGSHHE